MDYLPTGAINILEISGSSVGNLCDPYSNLTTLTQPVCTSHYALTKHEITSSDHLHGNNCQVKMFDPESLIAPSISKIVVNVS